MPAPTSRRVEFHLVGPHRVDLEFPDVVHIHYEGEVELSHHHGFREAMAALPSTTPLYLLRDARKGGFVAPETRRYLATASEKTRLVAVATYGSSFQSKTVFENMHRAVQVFRPNNVPVEFFATETEARAWIDAHREASART